MKKETLVLLHGMMCDERMWKEQIISPILKQKFDFFIPSIESFVEYNIEKIAKNILSEIKVKKFFLMGLSMGGIILMEIYRQAKQRILGVVLADTNYRAERKEKQLQRYEDLKLVNEIGLKRFVIEKMKVNYLSEKSKKKKEIYQLVVQMAEELGEKVFEKQSLALKNRIDYSKTISTITCPSLILCGEEDILCPINKHLEMKKLIPQAHLTTLKKAGHLSCLEKPKEFNQSIAKYI